MMICWMDTHGSFFSGGIEIEAEYVKIVSLPLTKKKYSRVLSFAINDLKVRKKRRRWCGVNIVEFAVTKTASINVRVWNKADTRERMDSDEKKDCEIWSFLVRNVHTILILCFYDFWFVRELRISTFAGSPRKCVYISSKQQQHSRSNSSYFASTLLLVPFIIHRKCLIFLTFHMRFIFSISEFSSHELALTPSTAFSYSYHWIFQEQREWQYCCLRHRTAPHLSSPSSHAAGCCCETFEEMKMKCLKPPKHQKHKTNRVKYSCLYQEFLGCKFPLSQRLRDSVEQHTPNALHHALLFSKETIPQHPSHSEIVIWCWTCQNGVRNARNEMNEVVNWVQLRIVPKAFDVVFREVLQDDLLCIQIHRSYGVSP